MKKIIILTAALSTAFLFSCQKDSKELVLSDQELAIIMDDAASDNVIETADYEVDYYSGSPDIINSINNGGKKSSFWPRLRYLNGEGPAVTVDPIGWSWPKIITVDYGDGIELINGSIIMGRIIINVSARPLTDGATREVSYEDFYVDSVHIEGGATRTFAGTDSTQRVFSNISNLTLTFPDGTVLYRSGERIRTFLEGFETPFYHGDDVILIEGFVNYDTSNGNSVSKTITKPLKKTGVCRFITAGTVSFTLNGKEFAVLDYGDGSCNNFATITKGGETRQITIGRRLRRPWRN